MEEVVETVEMATETPGNSNLIVILVIVLVATVFVIENWRKLKGFLGIKMGFEIHEQEQAQEIKSLKAEVSEMSKEVDCIKGTQADIKAVIDKLDNDLTEMQKKQDSADRARIKDRISQSYSYFKDRGQWSSMERESFYDLIASYELAGGTNSFVHEVCLPRSQEWKIVD